MSKKILWLLMSELTREDVHLAIPVIAWMAKEAGVEFECYLESERNGRLFARTGSTVLGGHHHQQFNYLNSVFDVKYILYGDTAVFKSSIQIFGAEVIAEEDSLCGLYRKVAECSGQKPERLLFTSSGIHMTRAGMLELGPYIYPEIFFRKALVFPVDSIEEAKSFSHSEGGMETFTLFLSEEEDRKIKMEYPDTKTVDEVNEEDDYGVITLRIAERWKHRAKALAFGDPAAILSQLASLSRDERISVYGRKTSLKQLDIVFNEYAEATSEIAGEVVRLAEEIGNLVIVGRQTGDGDLFEWAKGGVCIQIMDPNRPAFPIVESVPHVWTKVKGSLYDLEPEDSTLLKYAEEGKILATIMVHSGEMAHNEAMLNLIELSSFTGLKLGLGVHAARYKTCPQMWELLNIPVEKGGVCGLIEPVLHSGGMGVMAEVNCPPHKLREHCKTALSQICRLAGPDAAPKGYYAFADTDLETLSRSDDAIYKAVEESGLEYFISSVKPGRNLSIYEAEKMIAINQTIRTQCYGSPFVRFTTVEELKENTSKIQPGWLIGTIDAPVISFNPYIWRYGSRFMAIVDWLQNADKIVNVTPHTIARYARILRQKGFVPAYK